MKWQKFLQISALSSCSLFLNNSYGQSSEFHIAISGGVGISVQSPKTIALVSPLIAFPKQGAMFSGELHYQFKNQFGLGILGRSIAPPKHIVSRFSTVLEQFFPDDYAAIHLSGVGIKNNLESSDQVFIFMSYNFKKSKWAFRPRVMWGLTEFRVLGARVVLKQQNSNQQSILSLVNEAPGIYTFYERGTIGIGGAIERSIFKHWSLFATTDWTRFSNYMKFKQTIENQVDGNVSTVFLENRSPVQMLHLSIGFLVRWGKDRRSPVK